MADIPDGLYDTVRGIVREGVRVLKDFTPEQISGLADTLGQRERGQIDDDAVVAATPAAAQPWMTEVLKKNWQFIISVLLTLAIYFQQNASSSQSEHHLEHTEQQTQAEVHTLQQEETELQQLVRQMIIQLQAQPEPRTSTPGRNDPCWCDSQTKYKYCHGAR